MEEMIIQLGIFETNAFFAIYEKNEVEKCTTQGSPRPSAPVEQISSEPPGSLTDHGKQQNSTDSESEEPLRNPLQEIWSLQQKFYLLSKIQSSMILLVEKCSLYCGLREILN